MKKLATLFALILVGFGLSGCGDSNGNSANKTQETSPIPTNAKDVDYRENQIIKIPLKEAMATTILFDEESIQNYTLTNGEAFEINVLKNLSDSQVNTLILKRKEGYNGVNSDVMIYSRSGKSFYFYIYSTDSTDPSNLSDFIVVKSKNYNLEKRRKNENT